MSGKFPSCATATLFLADPHNSYRRLSTLKGSALLLFVCFMGSAMVCLLPDESNPYLQSSLSVSIANYVLPLREHSTNLPCGRRYYGLRTRKIYFAWIRACENASLCSALRPSTEREATKGRKPLISVHYVPM